MPAAVIAALAPSANPAAGPAAPPSNAEPGEFARQLERASQDRREGSGDDNGTPKQAPADNRAARSKDETKSRSRVAGTDKPVHERKAAEGAQGDTPTAAKDVKDEKTGTASDAAALPPGTLAALPVVPAPAPVPAAGSARAGVDALRAAAASAQTAKADGAAGADAKAPGLRAAADAEATPPAFVLPNPVVPAAPQAEPSAPNAGAAPAAHESHIAAPFASPAFAPALGAQVSLLVREGIGEARLQINPPEMGPITVQIRIDGTDAQVNIAAEQAPTREALEQALPALAGALRENGLTLTGGGVFEQPRQPQDREASRGGDGRREHDDPIDGLAAAPRAAVARGVVDLYA